MLRTPAKNEKDGQRFLAEFILSTVEGLEMTKCNMVVISNERERSFFVSLFEGRFMNSRLPEHVEMNSSSTGFDPCSPQAESGLDTPDKNIRGDGLHFVT